MTTNPNKPVKRMTLRQLLTHSEKCARDLIELVHTGFLGKVGDFRDLSRPVRRRSHYPSMIALQNSLKSIQAPAWWEYLTSVTRASRKVAAATQPCASFRSSMTYSAEDALTKS